MFLRSLLTLPILAPLAAADLTVGPPGSGADFDDVGAALAAAPLGETIFVLPGTYSGNLSITQGVNLVGAGSDQTLLVASPSGGASGRHLSVSNLPADQQVRVAGFGLAGSVATTPGFGSGVELIGNEGSVTLADVVYEPSSDATGLVSSGAEALLDVTSCLQVILDRVRFDASGLEDTATGGTYGLNAEFALVFANDSDFLGGGELGPDGRPGVRLATAELWLTSTNVTGADGAIVVSDDPLAPVPAGGAGIAAVLGSRIEFFGGLGQSVRGGAGGGVISTSGTPVAAGPGGPGALLADSTSAVLASGTFLQGGTSQLGIQAPPSITDSTSVLLFFLEPQIGLTLSETVVSPGDSLTLDVGGLSNTPVGVFFGLNTQAPVFVSPFAGLLQISILQPAPLTTIQLGLFGSGQTTLTVPSFIPPGFRAYFQAADLSFTIAPSVSMPAFLQIGM